MSRSLLYTVGLSLLHPVSSMPLLQQATSSPPLQTASSSLLCKVKWDTGSLVGTARTRAGVTAQTFSLKFAFRDPVVWAVRGPRPGGVFSPPCQAQLHRCAAMGRRCPVGRLCSTNSLSKKNWSSLLHCSPRQVSPAALLTPHDASPQPEPARPPISADAGPWYSLYQCCLL